MKYLLATLAYFHIPLQMFRITPRVCSTTLRHQCIRRYAMVSESIPDGPPVTATNREYVQACSKFNLYLLKVLKQLKGDSGRLSVSRKKTVHHRLETLGPFGKNSDLICPQPTPDSLLVTLDDRPLKTPSGRQLALPPSKRLLAALVANEWEVQETTIKLHTLPLVIQCIVTYPPCLTYLLQTSLASRAIDGFSDQNTRQGVIDALLQYFDTDTIWCI